MMTDELLSLDATAAVFTALAAALALYALGFVFTSPKPHTIGKVTQIVVYPLKSARGISVPCHKLDDRGLEFDRLWMVVDEGGAFLSQRRAPKLATVDVGLPKSHDEPLRLSAPGAEPLVVPVQRTATASSSVRVWDDRCAAIDQGDAAAAWCARVLGVEGARLVRMADTERRACSPKYAGANSTTAFSDGFPLLLANEASLHDLNQRLAARDKPTIPMNRFRPNLVVNGAADELTPFAEDGWARVALRSPSGSGRSSVSFGVVKPCARCKMPTIDQASGVPDGRGSAVATKGTADDDDEGGGPAQMAEPTATLRTFRTGALLGYRKAGWRADVFFGQNLTLEGRSSGASVAVGDLVLATPRRPRGLFSRGVCGVDY